MKVFCDHIHFFLEFFLWISKNRVTIQSRPTFSESKRRLDFVDFESIGVPCIHSWPLIAIIQINWVRKTRKGFRHFFNSYPFFGLWRVRERSWVIFSIIELMEFVLQDFLRYTGRQGKYQHRRISQILRGLSYLNQSIIEVFQDSSFQSYLPIPIVKVDNSHKVSILKVWIHEQLYLYWYSFRFPDEFLRESGKTDRKIKLFLIQVMTQNSLKKEFHVSDKGRKTNYPRSRGGFCVDLFDEREWFLYFYFGIETQSKTSTRVHHWHGQSSDEKSFETPSGESKNYQS